MSFIFPIIIVLIVNVHSKLQKQIFDKEYMTVKPMMFVMINSNFKVVEVQKVYKCELQLCNHAPADGF